MRRGVLESQVLSESGENERVLAHIGVMTKTSCFDSLVPTYDTIQAIP